MYVNALGPGYNARSVSSEIPYPSIYTYPFAGPVLPPLLTNINKSPPLIKIIFPISVSFSPKRDSFPPEMVNVVISPFKNSVKLSKTATTVNPVPGGPVIPVLPFGPVTPVAPRPVFPVGPISPCEPGTPLSPG
jgi:hypothetical protein